MITIAFLVLLVVLLFYIILYTVADKPRREAYDQAKSVAEKEVGMQEYTDFYMYQGNEHWDVITGVDKKGKEVGVWIPDGKDKPVTIALSEGISEEKAIAYVKQQESVEEIMSAKLGMEKNKPLWEVTYLDKENNLGYYYIDFYGKEVFKKIGH